MLFLNDRAVTDYYTAKHYLFCYNPRFPIFFNTIAIPIRLRIFVSYFPSSVTEDTGKETTKMLTEHGDAKREKKGPILNCKKI